MSRMPRSVPGHTPTTSWVAALYADDRPRSPWRRLARRWNERTRRLPRPAAVAEHDAEAWMAEVLRRIPA